MRAAATFILFFTFALGGCTSSGGNDVDFSRRANQVQAGTPKAEVLKALGKPDEKHSGVAGVPRVGAQPPMKINAGSRYEEWVYRRGESEYHVFMGPSTVNPGHWEVLSVSGNPRGAVAH